MSETVETPTTASEKLQNEQAKSQPELTPEQLARQQARRKELNIPEGMSKKQWKKEQRRLRWEDQKEDFKAQRREKKKALKQQRKEFIRQAIANGEELPKRDKLYKPEEQETPIAKLLIDCEFDDMMSLKEVISLSSQITRCYAANRRTKKPVNIEITSFNKRLRERFDKDLPQYHLWNEQVQFKEENLESVIKDQDLSRMVYLSADTEETLDTLEPNMTYILGGIVDKGRYKNLCLEKAKKLGLATKRLPIDEFIKLSGRRVLATSHVFELLVKWYELKDWKQAFETVLPERKMVKGEGEEEEEEGDNDAEEEEVEGEHNAKGETVVVDN